MVLRSLRLQSSRYLGVFFVSARLFRANIDKAKRSFSKAANCILSHLQGHATEEVIFHLLKTKAIPILLYATEAVEPSLSIIRSLDFCFTRFVIKVLKSANSEVISTCMDYFGLALPSSLISTRVANFKAKFKCIDNDVCVVAACLRS